MRNSSQEKKEGPQKEKNEKERKEKKKKTPHPHGCFDSFTREQILILAKSIMHADQRHDSLNDADNLVHSVSPSSDHVYNY